MAKDPMRAQSYVGWFCEPCLTVWPWPDKDGNCTNCGAAVLESIVYVRPQPNQSYLPGQELECRSLEAANR